MLDLLWHLRFRTGSTDVSLPSYFWAPSWSWASLDAEIYYDPMNQYNDTTLYSSFVDGAIESRTNDDTGMLRGGCIRMKGPLIKAKPEIIERDWDEEHWLINGRTLYLPPDFNVPSLDRNENLIMARMKLSRSDSDTCDLPLGNGFVNHFLAHQTFYFLFICTCENASDKSDGFGLVLIPTGVSDGEYIRVSYFHAFVAKKVDVLLSLAKRLPRAAYEESDESGELLQYTIKII